MQRALVLGGGGITGIAWELGLLAGLSEAGVDLTTADLVVGTSAGSVVGAQITSGLPLEELYERQLAPPEQERLARVGRGVLAGWVLAALLSRGNSEVFARRVGRQAIRTAQRGRTPTLEERLTTITSRLRGPAGPGATFGSPRSTRCPASFGWSPRTVASSWSRLWRPAVLSPGSTHPCPSTAVPTSTAG